MPKNKSAAEPVEDIEGLSRELRRLQLLVQLVDKYRDLNMAEVARRTGVNYSHLTKLMKPDGRGYTGLSADIVRKMRDGLQISPDFFFDPELSPVRSEEDLLNIYSLEEQRQKRWQQGMEARMLDFDKFRIEHSARLLELQAQLERKDSEILRLKHELAGAQARGAKTRQPK